MPNPAPATSSMTPAGPAERTGGTRIGERRARDGHELPRVTGRPQVQAQRAERAAAAGVQRGELPAPGGVEGVLAGPPVPTVKDRMPVADSVGCAPSPDTPIGLKTSARWLCPDRVMSTPPAAIRSQSADISTYG